MIRPEAKAQILRWREVLIGGGALLVGIWWLMQPGFLLKFPGVALLIAGAALIWIGVQRARFRSGGAGPGAVQVDEGQVIYYGPLTGGAVDLRELGSITLDPTLHPTHWRLNQPGHAALLVPVNADGADALFDAFATLPGLRMAQLLQTVRDPGLHPVVIWQRDKTLADKRKLH